MITPQLAATLLADETRLSTIPMAPDRFRYRYNRDAKHDFAFFGHQPVRAVKQSNRWKFNEPEVRAAGRAIAALPWDPEDLVDPRPGGTSKQGGSRLQPTGWRAEIHNLVDRAARAAHAGTNCPCDSSWGQGHEMSWGLRCGLTAQSLRETGAQYAIACVLPVASLVWTDRTWLIPRTLAFILDSREATEEALGRRPALCKLCGTTVTDPSRRAATSSGWKILCSACAQTTLLSYNQQFKEKTYGWTRENGPPAEDYTCMLCDPPRQATNWDHCHEHDLIRGPLCGSCNTMEGHGKDFLTLKGATAHLMRCTRCRAHRTLPENHRLAALRRHLHLQRGAEDCDRHLHMCVSLDENSNGGFDCSVMCQDRRIRSTKKTHLNADDVNRILTLAAQEGLSDLT
ncbi:MULTISPECIES: endonuclease domain-containing protein [unclassified Streptomyces]|uniref:endonuclease domain-containing protein n=1 Tax=unclassified Streptomyces TaxID=2593676 RepID=UPI0037FCBEE9